MSNYITWPKELRANAKKKGKSLIAIGSDGIQHVGLTDRPVSTVLVLIYIQMVEHGKTLKGAIAYTKMVCTEPHYQELFVGLEDVAAEKPQIKLAGRTKKLAQTLKNIRDGKS